MLNFNYFFALTLLLGAFCVSGQATPVRQDSLMTGAKPLILDDDYVNDAGQSMGINPWATRWNVGYSAIVGIKEPALNAIHFGVGVGPRLTSGLTAWGRVGIEPGSVIYQRDISANEVRIYHAERYLMSLILGYQYRHSPYNVSSYRTEFLLSSQSIFGHLRGSNVKYPSVWVPQFVVQWGQRMWYLEMGLGASEIQNQIHFPLSMGFGVRL